MRSLVFTVALLLLVPAGVMIGPVAAEHGGSHGPDGTPAQNRTVGNASADPCREADDRRACMQDVCSQDPEARGCQRLASCEGSDCAAASRACVVGHARACEELHELDDIRLASRHVRFDVHDDGSRLGNYSTDGKVLVDSIRYGDDDSFEVDQRGARIRFTSDSAQLEIHDTPTGDFWFRGGNNDTIMLVFPDSASLSPAPGGHLVDYGDRTARLAGDATVDGQTATATGHLSFFATVGRGPAVAAEAIAQAKAAQHVGAEISVDEQGAQVTAYDDVAINVTVPAVIAGNDTMRVRLDANLSEGRTFILDVDPQQLGGEELQLRYFDVRGDQETEVVFLQADSLADVLDPTDDGGQPEYWTVQDADGLHVMVSVPVWSVHVIEIASIGEFLVQPSVLLGMAAGFLGVAMAGTAMFWPRRQEDEFLA